MKRLLASLILTGSLLPATASAAMPQRNTVFYFDYLIRVTQRVLDGSIYPEIDRVHPFAENLDALPPAVREQYVTRVQEHRLRNRQAVQEHCKRSRRVLAPREEAKCGAGFSR